MVGCGVVWCGVVWCGVVWCGVVWCGVVWCGVVWYDVVWCGVVWCGVVRSLGVMEIEILGVAGDGVLYECGFECSVGWFVWNQKRFKGRSGERDKGGCIKV